MRRLAEIASRNVLIKNDAGPNWPQKRQRRQFGKLGKMVIPLNPQSSSLTQKHHFFYGVYPTVANLGELPGNAQGARRAAKRVLEPEMAKK
jgi:hypothetical protein